VVAGEPRGGEDDVRTDGAEDVILKFGLHVDRQCNNERISYIQRLNMIELSLMPLDSGAFSRRITSPH
jgi:hypothetical protein